MKTLKEYLKENYKMEIIQDEEEGGYVVSFPELPGCITSGENIESALKNAEDAKRAWFKAVLESGDEQLLPKSAEEYSGQFKIRLPKSLHKELAEKSKREGVSMNQYCVYLLSHNDVK